MKTLSKIFFFMIVISSWHFTNAQVVGVIYSKSEADQKFGQVLNSISISTSQLNSLLDKSGNYLLFKINGGNLYILAEGRKPLFPDNLSIQPDEVFKIVSISKIKELLNLGQNQSTFFEERKNVCTISNGDYTIEEISDCPPFCD